MFDNKPYNISPYYKSYWSNGFTVYTTLNQIYIPKTKGKYYLGDLDCI